MTLVQQHSLQHLLENYVCAQKRTGRSRQFVVFCDDQVYKGPYTLEKLTTLVNRTNILRSWEAPFVVYPSTYYQMTDGWMVVYPNIMAFQSVFESEVHTESFSSWTVRIRKNPPITDIGKLTDTQPWIYQQAYPMLITWCMFFVLGVGDTGFRNVLATQDHLDQSQRLYFIDFDESSAQETRDSPYFYLTKDPAVKRQWYPRTGHLYNQVADYIDAKVRGTSGCDIARLDQCVALLRKYHIPQTVTAPAAPLTGLTGGLAAWHGLQGGSTTFSGMRLDVAKSAVQKYIRRNIPQKAVQAALEIHALDSLGGKAGVSNLYNRLGVIAAEDIGVANVPLVMSVLQFVSSKDRDPIRLTSVILDMCASKKTRLSSHAWRAYATTEGAEVAHSLGVDLKNDVTPEMNKFRQDNNNCNIFLPTDPEYLKGYVLAMLYCLYTRSFAALTWASEACDLMVDTDPATNKTTTVKVAKRNKYLGGKRGTTTDAHILLWKALGCVLNQQLCDTLCEAAFTYSESRVFLSMAILCALYQLPYGQHTFRTDVGDIDVGGILRGEYTLTVDDYVVDKHTREGRQRGKTIHDFVTEGAHVENEDPAYKIEILQRIYETR